VTSLALAVAATSIVVPRLASAGSTVDGRAVAGVATAGKKPAGTAPVASPTAASPSAAVAAAPPSPDQSQPAPSPSPSLEAFRAIRIAATDPGNERYGVKVIACPTCASGSRVQYVGQTHALVVHVRNVPVAGRRTLTIFYETHGHRPLDVIINGGSTISLDLPGKDSWTTPAEVRLPIDLPVGDTIIRLFHNTLPAPDLDQFVIS
jgi:hypothetical protein